MEDTCVCCGEYVPEGRMVCYSCEMSIEKQRPYKEILIEQVKSLGQEVIDRAEDLVGKVGNYISIENK